MLRLVFLSLVTSLGSQPKQMPRVSSSSQYVITEAIFIRILLCSFTYNQQVWNVAKSGDLKNDENFSLPYFSLPCFSYQFRIFSSGVNQIILNFPGPQFIPFFLNNLFTCYFNTHLLICSLNSFSARWRHYHLLTVHHAIWSGYHGKTRTREIWKWQKN